MIEEARNYLNTLPPHVRSRKAAKLIESLLAEVDQLHNKMANAAAMVSQVHCCCVTSSAVTGPAIQRLRCEALELLSDKAAEAAGGEE